MVIVTYIKVMAMYIKDIKTLKGTKITPSKLTI